MKKLLIIILSLAIIGIFAHTSGLTNTLFKGTAYAVGDLIVNWGVPEGQPIFLVNNIVPGDSETHTVNVANGATVARQIGVMGIKTLETGNLSSVMEIVISQNGTDMYGGSTGVKTLAEFFTESGNPNGISLSNLAPSTNTDYVFTVTFKENAGNDFQGQQIKFDLKIGMQSDIPEACSEINFGTRPPILGTQGSDVIEGTSRNDLIITFEGDDVVDGKGGNDCIVTGIGRDIARGGNGRDILIGGLGQDTLLGENGNDMLFGDEENDALYGGNGNDTIQGSVGSDTISGGNDRDTVFAGDGNDDIEGNNGNDTLNGEKGFDNIRGGNGADTIDGGDDIDVVNGNNGQDTCTAEAESNCEL